MTPDSPAQSGSAAPGAVYGVGFAAVWVFGFVILRIFAVSGYDWNTAFLVSTTMSLDDGVSLLFGSLMAGEQLTAALITCAVPLLAAAALWGDRERRATLALLTGLGVALMVGLIVSERIWWPLPATVALFGILALARLLPRARGLRHGLSALLASIVWLIPAAALVLAAVIPTPWLPEERIVTVDGPVRGYVLSVDSGYLNVLTDDQEFVILLTSDVISRE